MSARLRLSCALAVVAAAVTAAPTTASAQGWRCEAAALGGSLLGNSLETVSAGDLGRDCLNQSSTLPGALPAPLAATSVAAVTSFVNGRAVAAGGVTDLRVRALPTLPVQLPEITIPDSLGAVTVPLPTDPLLPLLPSSIDVDLRPAIQALLPTRQLPTLDLVSVQGVVAYALGSCQNGLPKLSGLAQVAGLKVGGLDTPVGQVVDQAVSLLPAGSIDTASIDLSKVVIPSVPLIPDATLRPIVESALQPLLDSLPDVSIPAALAQVKVTPGEQTESNGVLTQRALRIQASVLGTSIADLTVGTASLSGLGVDCQPTTPAQAALACTKHKLALIDVLPRRSSVLLLGAADQSLAGRTVKLVFDATGETVAEALVKPDGSFSASAPLPPKGLRSSNLARYRAVLGPEKSLNLKLQRRMLVTDTNVFGGKVTITGRITGVLARGEAIVVKRRTSCTTMEKVATVMPGRDGRFSVTFKAPKGQVAPVYRLQTRVRKSRTNPKTFPTFTLPRAVSVV